MCGFVGVLQPASRGPVGEETLRRLLPYIRHRGPDQEGVYVRDGFGVAACRLAIRGGSEGDQPWVGDDGRVLVFNGELMSTDPVRSDTALLGSEGSDVALLDGGMFAYAEFAGREHVVFVNVDALGIKPLFHATVDGAAWFGSELKPLLAAHPALRTPDLTGLAELAHFGRPRTTLPFAGAHRVTSSTALVLAPASHVCVPPAELDRTPLSDPVDELRAAWEASARRAAAVDGPVSLFLSGGLDSSAVAAWSGRDDLLCLTGRFGPHGGDLDESELAAAVATRHGLRHEVIDLRDEDLITDLPEVIRALEVPMMGPGSLATWRMAKRAREHGKVVLSGTGGDELLGGYARTALALGRAGPWTRGYEPLRARIEAAGTDAAARLRAASSRFTDLAPVLDPAFLRSLPIVATPGVEAEESPLAAHLREERDGTLRGLLHVEDRVTSAHGLEARPVASLGDVPWIASRLPAEWLIGPDGEGKRVLRAALEGHIPERVRMNPRKRGFPTPFARAARTVGRERLLDMMHDRRFVERGWWDVDACRALLDEERPVFDRALWAVCSWEIWARLFLDGDAFSEEPPRT